MMTAVSSEGWQIRHINPEIGVVGECERGWTKGEVFYLASFPKDVLMPYEVVDVDKHLQTIYVK